MRILVVEDEADLADFVVRGLREDGFTVEHALDSAGYPGARIRCLGLDRVGLGAAR